MNKSTRSILMIVAGALSMAVAYVWFLIPAKITPGGVSGAATIIYYLCNLPVGLVSLIINIPLFILGFKNEGREFVLKTLLATVLLSAFTDYLPLKPLADDPMLCAVFGGAILGLGLGLVVLAGATTGGTDMCAKLLVNKLPGLNMAWTLFAIDMLVIIAAMIAFSPIEGLYSLITIFVSTKVMDFILEGFQTARAFTVISSATERIGSRIMNELERGVTCLKGRGMYSGRELEVLYCVVSNREIIRLKQIIKEEDENAFIVISDAHEVGGEGFTYNRPEMSFWPNRKNKSSKTIMTTGKDLNT